MSAHFSRCRSVVARQAELFKLHKGSPPAVFDVSPIPAVNVSCVPQRSPLRYPGGKTWLVPHVRAWIGNLSPRPWYLIEPFAGGGIVSLTAVMEGLVDRCLMSDLDSNVAAFWKSCLEHGPDLRSLVAQFEPTRESVTNISSSSCQDVVEQGFRTLVLNRTRRGGILASGASLTRLGENGKGISSRWYPETIEKRLRDIESCAQRIEFREADGLQILEGLHDGREADTILFVDPPYTAGGKRAGKRLYAHNDLDHQRLFEILSGCHSEFLMTYDQAPEIESLILKHGFHAVRVMMKNTHHARVPELVITRRAVFV